MGRDYACDLWISLATSADARNREGTVREDMWGSSIPNTVNSCDTQKIFKVFIRNPANADQLLKWIHLKNSTGRKG